MVENGFYAPNCAKLGYIDGWGGLQTGGPTKV